MNKLTDLVMLRARKRLAEHLTTPPATRAEADTIRQRHLDSAEFWDREADNAIYTDRTAAEIGRGPTALSAQHAEGVAVCHSVQHAMELRNYARRERQDAAAWTCDGDDMADVWTEARDELQRRVDHYQRLVVKSQAKQTLREIIPRV